MTAPDVGNERWLGVLSAAMSALVLLVLAFAAVWEGRTPLGVGLIALAVIMAFVAEYIRSGRWWGP